MPNQAGQRRRLRPAAACTRTSQDARSPMTSNPPPHTHTLLTQESQEPFPAVGGTRGWGLRASGRTAGWASISRGQREGSVRGRIGGYFTLPPSLFVFLAGLPACFVRFSLLLVGRRKTNLKRLMLDSPLALCLPCSPQHQLSGWIAQGGDTARPRPHTHLEPKEASQLI